MSGWVAIPRWIKSEDISLNPLAKDRTAQKLFMWALLDITYKDSFRTFEGQKIMIPKGCLIFTYKDMADQLNINKNTVLRVINKLVDAGMVARTETRTVDGAVDGAIARTEARKQPRTVPSILKVNNVNGLLDNLFLNWDGSSDGRYPKSDQLLTKKSQELTKDWDTYNNKQDNKEQITNNKIVGESSGDASGPPLSVKSLIEMWNELSGPILPKVRIESLKASSPRVKKAKARLKENPDLEYWRKVITAIAESDFCKGVNDRGWVADFEFLVRPDTHLRALEGKYRSKEQIDKDRYEARKQQKQAEREPQRQESEEVSETDWTLHPLYQDVKAKYPDLIEVYGDSFVNRVKTKRGYYDHLNKHRIEKGMEAFDYEGRWIEEVREKVRKWREGQDRAAAARSW